MKKLTPLQIEVLRYFQANPDAPVYTVARAIGRYQRTTTASVTLLHREGLLALTGHGPAARAYVSQTGLEVLDQIAAREAIDVVKGVRGL